MKASFDPNCQLLAAQYVRKQCKQLLGQLEGIRSGTDVEFVHRARVASRRLNAALRVFADCFPHSDVERWRKRVRKFTKDLGTARDLDVQREFLAGVLARLDNPLYHPGIARLLVRTELARDKLQRKTVEAIDRLQGSEVIAQMLALAKAVLKDPENDEVSVTSPSVLETAGEHINARLNAMLTFQGSLENPHARQEHHRMRIAAKRLRYTMEVYKPAYEGRLDDSLETVKQLQTLLGELHDCDVWIERLPAMLDEERTRIVRRYGHPGPLDRLEPGIRYLQEERQRQREVLFRQLGDYWREQTRLGVWEKIARAAHERAQNQRPAQQIIALQADSRNSGESSTVKLGGDAPLEHKASEPRAAGSGLLQAMVGCTPER